MRFVFLLVCFASASLCVSAQTYADSIASWRKQYTADLLSDPRKPIQASQVRYLNFYPADPAYKVQAKVIPSPGSQPFLMDTHSGKQKPFKEYGILVFTLNGEYQTLHIYQMVNMINDAGRNDELFVPFYDQTNYAGTYAGGRYIDLSLKDVVDGKIWIDFNKAYNPYCAYADGFSCPIPPRENSLHIEVKAGEKVLLN